MMETLTDINLPKLEAAERVNLEAPITLEELEEMMKPLPLAGPRVDGLASEFYKTYRAEVLPTILAMLNEALDRGTMPESLRGAIIIIPLLKPNKPSTDCGSYRQLSMLKQDSKILTAVLANRLRPVINKLIQLDQTGYVLRRSISDNLRRLHHVIEQTGRDSQEVALISLDVVKAFDSNGLDGCLERIWGRTHILEVGPAAVQ